MQPLRARFQQLEADLDRLHEAQSELANSLARPELYGEDGKAELLRLLDQKRAIDGQVESTEAAWLDAGEALEAAERVAPGPEPNA